MNKIKNAFDTIHAEQELKNKTKQYIYTNVYNKKQNKNNRFVLALASLAIMFITITTYITPVMAISLDTDSSIQFEVNKFNRVISVTAYDENTNDLIQSLNLKHKDYEEAFNIVIDKLESSNLIDKDSYLNISVSTKDSNLSNRTLNKLENKYKKEYKNLNCNEVDKSYQNEAKQNKMSIGQYQEFIESQKNNPNLTIEEFKEEYTKGFKQKGKKN